MKDQNWSVDSTDVFAKARHALFLLLAFAVLAALSACHSYHVDASVENRTGKPVNLLEVDYPSASFGADNLSAGAVFHYRIQLRGNGPLKIQYTASDKRQVQIDGPMVSEPQEGAMQIVLLPEGKADFSLHLTKVP